MRRDPLRDETAGDHISGTLDQNTSVGTAIQRHLNLVVMGTVSVAMAVALVVGTYQLLLYFRYFGVSGPFWQ